MLFWFFSWIAIILCWTNAVIFFQLYATVTMKKLDWRYNHEGWSTLSITFLGIQLHKRDCIIWTFRKLWLKNLLLQIKDSHEHYSVHEPKPNLFQTHGKTPCFVLKEPQNRKLLGMGLFSAVLFYFLTGYFKTHSIFHDVWLCSKRCKW